MSRIHIFLLAAVLTLALAAAAGATTVRAGKPVKVKMHGVPCSVTVNPPAFDFNGSGIVLRYSGSVSCMGGAGLKTVQVCAQVQNGTKWFTLPGSCVTQGPRGVNPLRVSNHRSAFLGHPYRVHASGQVSFPTAGGTRRSAVANSRAFAP